MTTTVLSPNTNSLRVARPRRAAPNDVFRPTRAEIDLGHVRHNFYQLRKAAAGAAVYGVLKADAYGHGAPALARTLERAGIEGFAVALLEEALELRAAGITKPVLVMGGYYGGAWGEVVRSGLVPVVYEAGQIEALAREVRYLECGPVDVHLKLDTGMARLGVRPAELARVLAAFDRHREVRLDGLMTHLACADAAEGEAVGEQLAHFRALSAEVEAAGFRPRVRHAANSAALLSGRAAGFEIVRPGLALYGVAPTPGLGPTLRAAMRVRSEVVALRDLAPGEACGYGWAWRASRPSRVATVPMGYADGLPRALSNRGALLVRGRRAPIIGAVSMDAVSLDVTDLPGVAVGDEAVVLGTQQGVLGSAAIDADEIAAHAGTVAWEVLTNISRRVPRFYHGL